MLKPGGMFIFDISTLSNSLEHFNKLVNVEEDDSHLLIHRAEFNSRTRMQQTTLTIFQKEDELYRRLDDKHLQKIYLVEELLCLSTQSPLVCKGIYSTYTGQNLLKVKSTKLDKEYPRLFFALKKEK